MGQGTRLHLGVLAVRLGLLCVKGVNRALHEHVGQYQVLQALDAPGVASFIVVLECLHSACQRFSGCCVSAHQPEPTFILWDLSCRLCPQCLIRHSSVHSDCTTPSSAHKVLESYLEFALQQPQVLLMNHSTANTIELMTAIAGTPRSLR